MTADDIPAAVLARLRAICGRLPEAVEEAAWTGRRWRVRSKTFAHVVGIADGWPPAYARAARRDGPLHVLTFESSGPELEALTAAGAPFFKPPWRRGVVGLVLEEPVDWREVGELVTDSYRLLAPNRLAAAAPDPPT
jgi:hypothetical protein